MDKSIGRMLMEEFRFLHGDLYPPFCYLLATSHSKRELDKKLEGWLPERMQLPHPQRVKMLKFWDKYVKVNPDRASRELLELITSYKDPHRLPGLTRYYGDLLIKAHAFDPRLVEWLPKQLEGQKRRDDLQLPNQEEESELLDPACILPTMDDSMRGVEIRMADPICLLLENDLWDVHFYLLDSKYVLMAITVNQDCLTESSLHHLLSMLPKTSFAADWVYRVIYLCYAVTATDDIQQKLIRTGKYYEAQDGFVEGILSWTHGQPFSFVTFKKDEEKAG